MKSFKMTLRGAVMAIMAAGIVACSESTGGEDDEDDEYDHTALIDTYVDNVVIPTYADMKDRSWGLLEAVNTFNSAKSQDNLNAVCAAWIAVREPWELSEAFLFGPCGDAGLNVDPNIDTWPFDELEFAALMGNSAPIEASDVCAYPEGLRGYHTIEYLIFEGGAAKTYTALTDRQIKYMVSAATVLRDDCIRVWAAWKGTSGISTKDQGAVTAMGSYWDVPKYFDGTGDPTINASSYASVFKETKHPYTSQYNVVEAIIDGCIEIADEVCDGKILAPYEGEDGDGTPDPALVESRFAWNSRVDFQNNMRSIRNAYYGSRDGQIAASSLASFAQEHNPALHAEIVAAINNAINKIGQMQQPFINHLTDDGTAIEAAATAAKTLGESIARLKQII